MELQIVQPSDDGYGEVNLQDLLKSQQRIRANVNIDADNEARQAAIRRFGLSESNDGGESVKRDKAELDRLRARNEELERENASLKAQVERVPAMPAIPQTSPNAVPAEPTVVVASAKTTGVPAAADPASAPAPVIPTPAPAAAKTSKASATPAAPAAEANPFANS